MPTTLLDERIERVRAVAKEGHEEAILLLLDLLATRDAMIRRLQRP